MQKYGLGNLKKMLQQVGSMGWLNKHWNIYGKDVRPVKYRATSQFLHYWDRSKPNRSPCTYCQSYRLTPSYFRPFAYHAFRRSHEQSHGTQKLQFQALSNTHKHDWRDR